MRVQVGSATERNQGQSLELLRSVEKELDVYFGRSAVSGTGRLKLEVWDELEFYAGSVIAIGGTFGREELIEKVKALFPVRWSKRYEQESDRSASEAAIRGAYPGVDLRKENTGKGDLLLSAEVSRELWEDLKRRFGEGF